MSTLPLHQVYCLEQIVFTTSLVVRTSFSDLCLICGWWVYRPHYLNCPLRVSQFSLPSFLGR